MKQNDKKHLTAENGRPIADNQNTQTAGVKGVVTLQDPWLTEKLAHFDRCRARYSWLCDEVLHRYGQLGSGG